MIKPLLPLLSLLVIQVYRREREIEQRGGLHLYLL